MRSIGIYTHWNVPNYGTFLQAYALQKIVEKICPDDDVCQIAYAEKSHLDLYYSFFQAARNRTCYYLLNPKFYFLFLKRLLNYKSIAKSKKFVLYYCDIKNTGDLTDKEFNEKLFDCVLIGSDVVWDFSRTIYKMDERFFGVGLNSRDVISYAASFGSVKSVSRAPSYVNNGLSRMSYISVRDRNSAELVHSISGRNADIVIDPTFLWNFWTDSNIPDKPVDYNYIAVYGSYFTKTNVKEIKQYAKENNLKIICLDSLNDHYTWCDMTITQDIMHPFLWCSYIKHAEIVMTCTYHGLLLSLIYKKRIVLNPLPFIMDKALSFIDFLGLTEVLTEEGSFSQKADWNWDYSFIDERINELKEESIHFIRKAVGSTTK